MAVRCQQDLLFLSQTCHVFESDLPCFDFDLPCLKSDLPIFRVSPSHFPNQSSPLFQFRPSYFFWSFLPTLFQVSLLIFRVRPPSHLLHSVLRILSVLCSDLIAMCTDGKIKDIRVCRKRLHCTTNSLARETNQKNTNRQARKREK